MRSWTFLLASSLLQIAWVYALRETRGFTRIVPIAVYALVGLGSTACLAKALEGISMSTAYAVWTGISVAGSVLVDTVLLRQPGALRLLCILLILAGTTGLKLVESPPPAERPEAERVVP
jgi:quaternary ammonium compound-resistance protein SugE